MPIGPRIVNIGEYTIKSEDVISAMDRNLFKLCYALHFDESGIIWFWMCTKNADADVTSCNFWSIVQIFFFGNSQII